MLKKLLILIIIIVVGSSAYFYYLQDKRISMTPYPYFISNYKIDDLAMAEKSEVLIVGDRMGKALDKQIESLQTSLKLPFYNWAKPHEGLHRTLYKLKSLKKFPAIIIYHGSSEELLEKKFNLNDLEKIEKNFKTFNDDKIISLIITFPILSKVFYQKIDYIDLSVIVENKDTYSAVEKLNQKQLSYLIYNEEIKELIEWARGKSVKLLFITTPLNSNIPPKETCAHANTNSITERHNEIEELIAKGQIKEAYKMASELAGITKVNAQSFFLLSKVARLAGDYKNSRMAFLNASAFDCKEWRGSAVYNSIMLKEANKKQIPVIDFDLELSANPTPETTFIDEIYPQNIFYKGLAKEIDETLKELKKAIK